MAFKTASQEPATPESPEKLLLDLPRRRIPNVLPHQSEVMSEFAKTALKHRDVALQLPTGSGKTLVGLLIGEWKRRKFKERVVYLCPTKQLVHQAVEQAEEKYGLSVVGFTGPAKNYGQTSKADYRTGSKIAITTYSSVFNTNPYFSDADTIIVDDAHVAENYIASLWSLKIERDNPQHQALHAAIRALLKPRIDPISYSRISGENTAGSDPLWVNKLPTPIFAELTSQLIPVISEHAEAADIAHPWKMIAEHLAACHLYLSSRELLLRPLVPPTWAHAAFEAPSQRIYMSATLGNGGDLERITGRRNIFRVPAPKGWDRQGVGRRFFIFPALSLKEEEENDLSCELMRMANRSLVLTPSDRSQSKVVRRVAEKLQFQIFTADEIETSKKPFITCKKAVAVVANRYDGIDFPGEECRLLFVEGFPKAMNLQERFIMSGMAANLIFNERVQTRVLQAIGRCTRSLEDFSAVVITGEDLPDYLADSRRTRHLHPELQAEIRFGVEQSKQVTFEDLIDNFSIFLKNGKEWEAVNQQIVQYRQSATMEPFPAMGELMNVVSHEIDYQQFMWKGDYYSAFASATRVLGGLAHTDLRGYRALWHYLAGSAARLASSSGFPDLSSKANDQFQAASKAAPTIPWLSKFIHREVEQQQNYDSNTDLIEQLERVESVLSRIGTVHDREFAKREASVLKGIQSKEASEFEPAHRLLGELIGFIAGKEETEGSPDPWWISGRYSFVFEDHSGADEKSVLDVTKARQVASHPQWLRAHCEISESTEIMSILITPVSKAREAAMPHLESVALWPLEEFRKWAVNALSALREVRISFVEPGDLSWRAHAAEVFSKNQLDAESLAKLFKQSKAKTLLTSAG
jgi:hypothetical protein